jgi:hypothetical protein
MKRILALILLAFISFTWDDFENNPTDVKGYKLYIARQTCTDPIPFNEYETLDPYARTIKIVECGQFSGWYNAFATTLGVNGTESDPSNVVVFVWQ